MLIENHLSWRMAILKKSYYTVIVTALLSCLFCSCKDCAHGHPNYIIFGDMNIDPDVAYPSGELDVEVSIWIFLSVEGKNDITPVEDVIVDIYSSRNIQGEIIDIIEPPSCQTDRDGLATAFIGSFTPGEAIISIKNEGLIICETFSDSECSNPLERTLVFLDSR